MKNKKTDKDRQGFIERLSKGLDIDAGVICRGFSAELRGKNRVELCGVRKIFTYCDNEISFVTSDGIFSIRGKRLCCIAYKRGVVIVEGDICIMGFFT